MSFPKQIHRGKNISSYCTINWNYSATSHAENILNYNQGSIIEYANCIGNLYCSLGRLLDDLVREESATGFGLWSWRCNHIPTFTFCVELCNMTADLQHSVCRAPEIIYSYTRRLQLLNEKIATRIIALYQRGRQQMKRSQSNSLGAPVRRRLKILRYHGTSRVN